MARVAIGLRCMSQERRALYPGIEPYDSGYLQVSALHRMYYEQSGNPDGPVAVFLHGGPGGGSSPKMRRLFDPAHWRIVLYDQRGCGRSTPSAELEGNTTWDLVADLERLRVHLGVSRWMVFGGSWGSTLALAYAQTHPAAVSALVLRGIFLLRRWELEWFYQRGTSEMFPDLWEDYLAPIPQAERGDLISAYHRRLTHPDRSVRVIAARAWAIWEARTSFLRENPDYVSAFDSDEHALQFARIECHYFVHGGFFEHEDLLLRGIDCIRHIPAVIVQGRWDVICPPRSAWELHRAWPEAELRIVPDAGHSAFEPGIAHELLEATDRFRYAR
jgi:proline iminopeptidase